MSYRLERGRMNEIEKAIEFIKDLMSEKTDDIMYSNKIGQTILTALKAQQADRWIPITERLPEKSGYYLIQQNCSIMDYMRVARFSVESQKFRNAEVKCYYEDVIAWRPLPEPWKEDAYAERN